MNGVFHLDTRQFESAIRKLQTVSKEVGAKAVNQGMLDVVGYAYDQIPPTDLSGGKVTAEASSQRAKLYLQQQLSQKIKIAGRSAKRTGQWITKGARLKQLQRRHLIAQMIAKKTGNKGLYGKSMKAAAANLMRKSTSSRGYLKLPLVSVIRKLNPIVQYKFPWVKTQWIKRWASSRIGQSTVIQAVPNTKPMASFFTVYEIRSHNVPKMWGKVIAALQAGLNWKAGKISRQADRIIEDMKKKLMQANQQTTS